MATAKIMKATAKGKSWKAEIYENGKKVKTIQGGQKGTKLGGSRTASFKARHGNKLEMQTLARTINNGRKVISLLERL